MRPSLAALSALLTATVLFPVDSCRAQFSAGEDSYAHLLAKYDRNGNGLLDDRERADLLAPPETQRPLMTPSYPLICEGNSIGGAGGSSASVDQPAEQQPQDARHMLWQRRQFAEHLPQENPHPDRVEEADGDRLAEESDDGYLPDTSPRPPEPSRRNVHVRNVVEYRMRLNESQAQSRPQSYARAATFGPVLGLNKQRVRFVSGHADTCCTARVSLYRLAGY